MIDLLKEIELLEQVCEAAEDGDFERAYAKDSFVADIRRQNAKAADK